MLKIKHPTNNSILLLAGCIILPLIIGFIGSLFTTANIPIWYASLNKPWFNPPNWLFGPVWTVLYILMGVSLWLVIKNGFSDANVRRASYVFSVQLIINLLWSVVFFGMHSPAGGLTVIIILIALIIATVREFEKISRLSAYLLIPYLCWTIIATILNAYVVILN
jgi:translocator protein